MWCNPIYLIASLAGRAFRETDLREIGRNLFPAGDDGDAAPAKTVIEWDCPEELGERLAAAGLHPLTPRLLSGRPLQKITSLQVGEVASPFCLAQVLFHGAVRSRLKAFLRTRLNSGSLDEFEALLHEALQELGLKDRRFPSPLHFDTIDYPPLRSGFTVTCVSAPEFSATGQTCRFQQFLG